MVFRAANQSALSVGADDSHSIYYDSIKLIKSQVCGVENGYILGRGMSAFELWWWECDVWRGLGSNFNF